MDPLLPPDLHALELVGSAIGLGRWTADAGHPVDVVLFAGRKRWEEGTFEHPCFYFRPRPLPLLDEVALVRAFAEGTLATAFPKDGNDAVPIQAWRVAFDDAQAPGTWRHPERAWLDTLRATTLAARDPGADRAPAAELSSSFVSRAARARQRRWERGAPGPGEPAGGVGFGALARALYAVPRAYDAEVYAGRPPPPLPADAPAVRAVVHGLACDAPWLLATEGLNGLLPRVLGFECARLRWSELMAILGAAPPDHWHHHPRRSDRGRRVVAAYRQLVELGYPPLAVAAAISGSETLPRWADSGAHKQRVEWENRLTRRGGWTSVVPILDDILPPQESPTDPEPLWAWFQDEGGRALTLLLRNRIAGGRLRLGGLAEEGQPRPSLNTLGSPSLWAVRPHDEPACPWIGKWLDYVGGDQHRPRLAKVGRRAGVPGGEQPGAEVQKKAEAPKKGARSD